MHNTLDIDRSAREGWQHMAVQQARRLTVEDLYVMDDLPERFEVIRGEIVEMTPPIWRHTSIGARVNKALILWLENHPIGEAVVEGGYVFSRDPLMMLIPDVSFLSAERIPSDEESDRILETIPELVIEVISPSDRASRVNAKVMTYLETGVKLVWVIDPPSKTATVHAAARPGLSHILHVGEALDGEDILPGFSLPIAVIFPTR